METTGKEQTAKTKPAFSLCVFCGSRSGDDAQYIEAAKRLGEWIGGYGYNLVYGGGCTGMMGALSEATLAAGGTVTGIIPESLVGREVARTNCTELIVTKTMHERKALMLERCNAIITLPGGIGTFEELFEFWTLSQLGYHNKPMALASVGGYFDDFVELLQTVQERDFVSGRTLDLMMVGYSAVRLAEDLYRAHQTEQENPLRPEETGVWAEGDRFDYSQPVADEEPKVCPFSGKEINATPAVSAEPVPPPQCPAHKN